MLQHLPPRMDCHQSDCNQTDTPEHDVKAPDSVCLHLAIRRSMRRSHGGLPRVRVSFPGSPGSPVKNTPRPGPWAGLLLLCGVLLLTGYAHIAGRIRVSDLGKAGGAGSSSVAQAAAAALHGARTAVAGAAGKAGADAGHMQSTQLGLDLEGESPMRLLSYRQQPASTGISFLQAQHGIRDPADALSRQPAVHGRVQKAGMADPVSWLNNHTDERLDSFLAWRLSRANAGGVAPANATSYTCPAADHPPLPFPGCHVFVNHE